MTPVQRKRRYRTDPVFRAAVLASNRRSREKHASPERTRLNALAEKISRTRESIAARLLHAERLERRLFALIAEREDLKAAVKRRRIPKT